MSVYLPKGCKTYYYDFWWRKQRYVDTTHQTRKEDAELVESQKKLQLRQQFAGIRPFDVRDTPRFQDWAELYLAYQEKFVERPDLLERAVSVVLEFWGARPPKPKSRPKGTNAHPQPAPYHDLRLGDPIADPSWLQKFERWIDARGVSGSTRNTYLSTMSGFYRVARQPEYRGETGIDANPFLDIRRSPPEGRIVALESVDVLRWIRVAPPHVRIAMAIAALAPKMRLQTILGLQWATHFDRTLTRITVYRHKTGQRTGLPQVTPIDPQLRGILAEVKAQNAKTPAPRSGAKRNGDLDRYVITYRGRRVESIKKATKRAAIAAGLHWGVRDGVTFHTLRHSIATLLAELGIGERLRMELMGHKEIRTTQKYTHLAARAQVGPHEQLSAAMPLRDVVFQPSGKPSGARRREPRKRQQISTRRRVH